MSYRLLATLEELIFLYVLLVLQSMSLILWNLQKHLTDNAKVQISEQKNTMLRNFEDSLISILRELFFVHKLPVES